MLVRFTARCARVLGYWGLIASLAVIAYALRASEREANQRASQPLFPPGCTVVLFAGLPGDIESENSFREQLQGWIDLVARDGRARRLVVLCDNPSSLTLPHEPASEALKGDRLGFLSLGPTLAEAKAPLVVVAWGHGGKQGATAVLHVRGPRITAEDFKSLAARAQPPLSHWILIFRGSGAFARQLAGAQRQVISSDFETSFMNDPIGMALLAKLASGKAAQSFEQLGDELGRATAAWYEERHLARTEEPTLWQENLPPRPLARSEAAEPVGASSDFADSHDQKGKAPKASDDKGGKTGAERPEPATNEVTGAWAEIKKIAPEKYPEADAVVLSRRLRCTLGSDPAVVTEQEEFIQILTPEGKQFGDFDVSFSPPLEEIEFLDCEVRRPDGKLVRLDPDAIGEGREPEPGDYQAQKRKFFSLPGVTPGAVIHVRYRTQWKEFPLPRISMELPVGHELPAIKTSIQVSVPKDAPFHFAFEKVSAPDPELKSTSYSTTYSWVLENIPAHRNEILVAPRQKPQLMISTFPDWKTFAEWYERISRLTDEVTPEIAGKAQELTAGAKSDQEKVLALYNYVTALRYVAVPLGINSVRPHAAANVLQNQFGDCKDKANLLNALLHSLNIDAHLVLVPRFSQALEAVPGLAFNHAISRVKLAEQFLWIDTTDDVCRFGLLPPGDSGRKVLTIDGQTTALTQLPAPEPKDHQLTLKGQITWPENTEGLPVKLQAEATGFPDYELRATAREAREHRASLPLLAARFRPVAGSFALVNQSATPVSSLQEDFTWQAQGTCIGLAVRSNGKGLLRCPFWVPREWDLALHQRHSPLFLNQGYPLTLQQDFEVALPPGTGAVALPPSSENRQGPLRWRIEWARMPGDKLAARLSAQLDRGELSALDTPLVQEQLRALLAALGGEATVTLPP